MAKLLSSIGFLSVVLAKLPPLNPVSPTIFSESTIDQRVDHFDYQSSNTYKQRYWTESTKYDPTLGVYLIYLCGEYTCSVPETRMYPFMIGQYMNA